MSARSKPISTLCDVCLVHNHPSRPHVSLRKAPITSRHTRNAPSATYTTTTSSPFSARTDYPSISCRKSRRIVAHPQLPQHFRTTSMSNRTYSTESTPCQRNSATTLHLPKNGLVPLPTRRVIALSGPDTRKFLQGLITKDVGNGTGNGDAKPPEEPFYCAFLDARGRVGWDVFVYPHIPPSSTTVQEGDGAWGCYIDVDAQEAANLAKHLKRHKLRSKVKIEVLPSGKEAGISEGGEAGGAVYAAWGIEKGMMDKLESEGAKVLRDPRFPGQGFELVRFVLPPSAPAASSSSSSASLSTRLLDILGISSDFHDQSQEDVYKAMRLLYGVPEGASEIVRESALPMECNIDLANGIDWRKGCYVGQELTIRTKHTGVVRKRVLPVRLYGPDGRDEVPQTWDEHLARGASLRFDISSDAELPLDIRKVMSEDAPGPKKSRPVGKLVARMGDVGLALCRLDVMVPWRFGGDGTIESGYQESQEFEVEGGARVKAFLPEELAHREREVWGKKKAVKREVEDVE